MPEPPRLDADPIADDHLVRTLEMMRKHAPDHPFTRFAVDLLEGRRTLRELTRDPAFMEQISSGMRAWSATWAAMDAGQRRALAEESRRQDAATALRLGLTPPDDDGPLFVPGEPATGA